MRVCIAAIWWFVQCMCMPPGLDAVQAQYALLAFLAVLILWVSWRGGSRLFWTPV